MLLQTKGKFFSKPNLIFNLILYYMLFLKQSKLAPQCSPQQHATPSSKPSLSPLLCGLPLCVCKRERERERERGSNNYSCKILWLRYMVIDPFLKLHSHSVLVLHSLILYSILSIINNSEKKLLIKSNPLLNFC